MIYNRLLICLPNLELINLSSPKSRAEEFIILYWAAGGTTVGWGVSADFFFEFFFEVVIWPQGIFLNYQYTLL